MISNSSSSDEGSIDDDEGHRGNALESAIVVMNEHHHVVDDDDDEEDSHQGEEEEESSSQPLVHQVQQALPQAREHSYLPGASHPLYSVSQSPASLFESFRRHHDNESEDDTKLAASHRHSNTATTENNDDASSYSSWPQSVQPLHQQTASIPFAKTRNKGEGMELSILELQGVVLFPGSTLPIRLHQREWIDHLGRLIDQSRTSPGLYPTVQLGILTAQPDSDDDDDENDDDDNNNTDQQRIEGGGYYQRRQSSGHQRVSWTRRAMGPARLRRLSEQLIQELGDLDDLLAQDDDDDDENHAAAADTNNGTGTSDDSDDEESAPPLADVPRVNSDFFRDSQTSFQSHHSTGNSAATQRSSLDPYAGRIGTIATITCTFDDAADDHESNAALDHSVDNRSRGNNTNPVWQMHRGQHDRPLVVTAIGTSRFRVLTSSSDDEATAMARQQANNPSLTEFARRTAAAASRRSMGGVKTMIVEELDDTPLSWPAPWLARLSPSCGLSSVSRNSNDQLPPPVDDSLNNITVTTTMHDINNYRNNHRMIHSLSCISPIPAFVYKSVWPWQLVDDIRQRLERLPTMTGLLHALAHNTENDNDDDSNNRNPTRFSFWLSANLALKWEERLRLLEMRSTVERLRCLQGRIQQEERAESILHCRECRNPLSRSSQIFGVGGAEGTTGAYVNEYGCIHQTITIRSLSLQQNNNNRHHDTDGARQAEEQHVLLTGGPQIKDSWFPGYAWTIMSCAFCASHLGWKFQRVLSPPQSGQRRLHVATGNATTTTTAASTGGSDNNRPEVFYGLSAASVVIYVPQPPPPGSSRQTRLFWQQRRRSSREAA